MPKALEKQQHPASEARVALLATVVAIVLLLVSLAESGGDVAGLLKFAAEGDEAAITTHVESLLERRVPSLDNLGHDGKFFFLQALDPLYLEPTEHAALLDRPTYRAQRMLYPLLAGVGGLASPAVTLWTMALVNLGAIPFGTIGTGRIAVRLGGSRWLGLAFALNPGIIFEFGVSGAGIVAFSCALWGTLATMENRPRRAAAWFVAAVLAREVMLLYLAGVCVHRLVTTRRIPWMLGGLPAVSVVAWAGYLRLRLDTPQGVDEVQEFGLPFAGMADAFDNWLTAPIDLALIGGLVIAMPLLVVRSIQHPNPLAWGAIGFVPLAIVMTRQVWWNFFDITRAVVPILTAYVATSFSTPATPPTRTDDSAPTTDTHP